MFEREQAMWWMASQKVTFVLDGERLEVTRRLVGSGEAPSVSGFGQYALGVSLDDVAR